MVAYLSRKEDPYQVPTRRNSLSHELFHGLSPEEFDVEAKSVAQAAAMTPATRARIEAQLIERLKTPVDKPSWGPDWVKHGDRGAAPDRRRKGTFAAWFGRTDDNDEEPGDRALSSGERDDADVISRNMERSRQVAHYRPLYLAVMILAIAIAGLAMFVDYQIIRGDVWTRALSNEFMVVPASLQASVIFKSMQVLFAVLIVHFMLKISGAYGRNALITAGFVSALVMVGCLGYLVAYNNMAGATSARFEQHEQSDQPQNNAIDRLFSTDAHGDSGSAVPA